MVRLSFNALRRFKSRLPLVFAVALVTFLSTMYLTHLSENFSTYMQVDDYEDGDTGTKAEKRDTKVINTNDNAPEKTRKDDQEEGDKKPKDKRIQEPKQIIDIPNEAPIIGQKDTSKEEENKSPKEDTIDFTGFNNVTGADKLIVPNIIHFIHFDKTELSFVDYIVLRAALLHQKPDKILIHTNKLDAPRTDKYWNWVRKDEKLWPLINFRFLEIPKQIFGQNLSEHFTLNHGSDIERIRLLMKYGGIYLDNDEFVIKSLDKYRKFEFVVNWDEDQYLGNQLFIAHKDARFLKLYLDFYKKYDGTKWYYNAGEGPTVEILAKHPELIHRVKGDFGADTGVSSNLYRNSKDLDWHKLDAIHLLMGHRYYMDENYNKTPTFNESNIIKYPYPFGEMAREVMAKLD